MTVPSTEIRAAVKRVRMALNKKSPIEFQTYYLLRDNRLHAQNGLMWASAPCPVDGTFLVAGNEFERAIDKLPEKKLVLEHDQDKSTLSVKGGRLRTRIQTLDPDLFHIPANDGADVPIDADRFKYALSELRPFVGESITRRFAEYYNFTDGKAFATNNFNLAQCKNSGIAPEADFRFPKWTADYVLAVDSDLSGMTLSETQISFVWEDGTKLLSVLGATSWPNKAVEIVTAAGEPGQEHIIDEGWRENVLASLAFGEGKIVIKADEIQIGRDRSETQLAISSATPADSDYSIWSVDQIAPVLERATHIDLTRWPKPMVFGWRDVTGIVAARKN